MSGIPANVKRIIDANVPEGMRDYYYQMVQKESSGRTNLGSSTGAVGLLQFTRGTGKLYGLVGQGFDNRKDPEANIRAGVRLTEDNRRTLTRRLGREPSYSELALAHQQGADTAANMITGKGNASPYNLKVNNVNPNASPQDAAARIMQYYGFGGGAGVPGVSLTSMPTTAPQMPAAPPVVAAPAVATPPAIPAAPDLTTVKGVIDSVMGPDGKGGKDTPMAGLEDMAKGFAPKVNPQAAQAAATINPMSSDVSQMANMQAAQGLLQTLLQQRRGRLGLTLTGMGAP